MTIPGTVGSLPVTSIGGEAFFDCSSLSAITVDASNPAYSSVDGVLFDKNQTALIVYPAGKVGGYTIPNSVTSIGDAAFAGCILTTGWIMNSVVEYVGFLGSDNTTLLIG